MKKKVLALVLAIVVVAALCIGLVACNDDPNSVNVNELYMPDWDEDYANVNIPSDFKFGVICLHGEESTYDKNFIDAAKKAIRDLGLNDSNILFKTNIPEGEECATAARELVTAGCDVIFADSFGHEPYLSTVAAANPNVRFCHATGTTAHDANAPANLYNAFASIYEGRYLAGIVAGMKLQKMIDDGKIKANEAKMGYVGAFPYAEVKSGYTSFFLGARSVCPSVTMEVQFTSSWYDVTKEKSTAEALIQRGCKLISQHADSMGAPNACEEAGVPNVSYNGSTIESCSKTFLVSSRIDWTPYFKYIIAKTAANEEIAKDWVGTIRTGSVVLTNLNADTVAPGTLKAVLAARAALANGTLNVFDCSKFTVSGANVTSNITVDAQGHVTSFMADVNTDANFTPDTQVYNNGIIEESKHRSAPYFDITIDGITLL